jgi:hypothetical protein
MNTNETHIMKEVDDMFRTSWSGTNSIFHNWTLNRTLVRFYRRIDGVRNVRLAALEEMTLKLARDKK